jgi:Spy/CpxP family protein refolding chaperone
MKKLFQLALLAGLALGLNFAVSAQDNNSQNSTTTAPSAQEKTAGKNRPGKMRDGNGKDAMMRGLNQLNLTDAQKQQLKNLRQNNQANDAARNEMRELMQAKRSGGALTAEQETRLKDLRKQTKDDSEKQRQQVLAILTPEQRVQLAQIDLQRKEKAKERRQNQAQTPATNPNQ